MQEKNTHDIRKFALVIFDCDGVLVDSERITNQVFAHMLNELGIPVTLDDMFERFVGRSMNQCLELITELLGNTPPADFVENYRRRTSEALATLLMPVAGIEAALNTIKLPCCVASSGDHEKMRTTLGITKLLPRFDGKLFSVTEVARGKPAPDVFLYAAGKYNVKPSACVVIEDTPTGVSAGIAAGMTVYGYSALTPAARLLSAGAHQVFSDMAELPALIDMGIPRQ
ncbi:MAG: HAD family phosphatase [Gammaproteobacteria bacterium]|nr:HAD family phosphatase [Gammaproteobacteria bacterium]